MARATAGSGILDAHARARASPVRYASSLGSTGVFSPPVLVYLESVPSGLAWGVEAAITRGVRGWVKGVEEAVRGDMAAATLEGAGADGRENTKV